MQKQFNYEGARQQMVRHIQSTEPSKIEQKPQQHHGATSARK